MSLVEKVESFNARLERIEAALFGEVEDAPSLPPSKQDRYIVCSLHTNTGTKKFYAGVDGNGRVQWSKAQHETFPDELSALKKANELRALQPAGGYGAPFTEKAA